MDNPVTIFQESLMQEFFKIRMTQAFGADWPKKVAIRVQHKYDTNHPYKLNYKSVYKVLCKEGVENLNEKRIDITTLMALIEHDYYNRCEVGTNFREHIKNIREDRNELTAHSTDRKDMLDMKRKELTALVNIRAFLDYLSGSEWDYPEKQEFVARYKAELDKIETLLYQEGAAGREALETEVNRRVYLESLVGERAKHAAEYIPLSYKVDDNTSRRFNLDELFGLPENSGGFVLFSKEAGYGKTWSVEELAGRCAEEALAEAAESKPTPVLVRMGELAVHEEPILKAVQDTLFPEDTTFDRARKFLNQKPVVLFIDGMDEAKQENKDSARRELARLRTSAQQLRIIGGARESDTQWYPAELKRYAICDLSERQVKDFITKLIPDEEQRKTALHDYFWNPPTAFLQNMKSPFYLKCYVEFVKSGERDIISQTDMMSKLLDKMIQREIDQKGFRATPQIVRDFLLKLAALIETEGRAIPVQTALKELRDNLIYDTEQYASVVQIKDTLVELQILKEAANGNQPVMLMFSHENYRTLYSPIANSSPWD